MWTDPIVDEIRAAAKEWSDQFQGDVHAMFEELRRLEADSDVPVVSMPPRPPVALPATMAPMQSGMPTQSPQST
jgi:hypothetical protein